MGAFCIFVPTVGCTSEIRVGVEMATVVGPALMEEYFTIWGTLVSTLEPWTIVVLGLEMASSVCFGLAGAVVLGCCSVGFGLAEVVVLDGCSMGFWLNRSSSTGWLLRRFGFARSGSAGLLFSWLA